ncbi:heat shock protein DnaJ family protein [Heterostelium album PN500]|uniref:Heat shock protein DnaJ family protein n=1 Tax=Heterostelium pallidum (strain ATCC 26659 / Pp 5 / PN500) TaxID=670386 RepID=D3BEC0_HETP5|nr:heat shock protein DnaJ family protein [Heterostelium album PN500]EFA80251.1 heat shock protein DnaJ family protein [Heterostelium album PN500]|eukprot:XP_020432371.1 heat shock protein DnaJ family protein [Heterostelium album PN500]
MIRNLNYATLNTLRKTVISSSGNSGNNTFNQNVARLMMCNGSSPSTLSSTSLFGQQQQQNNQCRYFRSNSPLCEEKRDPYEVLGVARDASKADVKKAFYDLAKKFHPDRNREDPNAHRKFAEISNAYDILSNENKRAMYDAQGHQGAAYENSDFNPNDMNYEEIFQHFNLSDLFGEGMMGGGGPGGRVNGADIQIKLNLDFMEAVNGTNKDVTFYGASTCTPCDGSGAKPGSKMTNCKTCNGAGRITKSNGLFAFASTCKSCKGQGKIIKDQCTSCSGKGTVQGNRTLNIKIPQGINNGMNIKLTGQGEPGEKGGRRGNLYVHVSVSEHELFKREGNDIHLNVPISLTQAILGDTITIPTLTGEVDLKVASGTQPNEKRVLKNKGVRSVNDMSYGNQYVHFIVNIPKSVTDKQKTLIQEFDQEEKNKHGPLDSLTHPVMSFWNSAMKRWRDYSSKFKSS